MSDTDDQWVSALEQRLILLRGLFPGGKMRPLARRAIMCAESPGNLLYNLFDRFDLDDEISRLYSYMCQRKIGRRPGVFWLMQGSYGLAAFCFTLVTEIDNKKICKGEVKELNTSFTDSPFSYPLN